jgi:hypothetical protein
VATTFPSYTPTSYAQILQTMASKGQLTGVTPRILAAIAQAESGSEAAGAGINSSGYGGYFGLHETQTYPAGKVTSGVLNTKSTASFRYQAKIAASALASYAGGPIARTNEFVTGHAGNTSTGASGDAKLVATALGISGTSGAGSFFAPSLDTPKKVSGTHGGTTVGGTPTTPLLTPGSDITTNPITKTVENAATWESGLTTLLGDITSPTWWERIGTGALGGILFVVGLVIFISQTTTGKKVVSQSTQAAGSGGGGAAGGAAASGGTAAELGEAVAA